MVRAARTEAPEGTRGGRVPLSASLPGPPTRLTLPGVKEDWGAGSFRKLSSCSCWACCWGGTGSLGVLGRGPGPCTAREGVGKT